jgi:hypothetical protein
MKESLKAIISVLLCSAFLALPGCSNTPNTKSKEVGTAAVQPTEVSVYYFHATRRCATCEAVEKVSRHTLEEKYGSKVAFISINREEESEHPLIEKHQINWQTLLVVKGDQAINLTNEAFLNARTKPEKLKQLITNTIEELLNP